MALLTKLSSGGESSFESEPWMIRLRPNTRSTFTNRTDKPPYAKSLIVASEVDGPSGRSSRSGMEALSSSSSTRALGLPRIRVSCKRRVTTQVQTMGDVHSGRTDRRSSNQLQPISRQDHHGGPNTLRYREFVRGQLEVPRFWLPRVLDPSRRSS
jgi:hypothetical protein